MVTSYHAIKLIYAGVQSLVSIFEIVKDKACLVSTL